MPTSSSPSSKWRWSNCCDGGGIESKLQKPNSTNAGAQFGINNEAQSTDGRRPLDESKLDLNGLDWIGLDVVWPGEGASMRTIGIGIGIAQIKHFSNTMHNFSLLGSLCSFKLPPLIDAVFVPQESAS
ncbi:hypothetical protein ACLKA6_016379 [Drosophila palustris]